MRQFFQYNGFELLLSCNSGRIIQYMALRKAHRGRTMGIWEFVFPRRALPYENGVVASAKNPGSNLECARCINTSRTAHGLCAEVIRTRRWATTESFVALGLRMYQVCKPSIKMRCRYLVKPDFLLRQGLAQHVVNHCQRQRRPQIAR